MNDELFISITADTLISEIPDYLSEFMPRAFVEDLGKTINSITLDIREMAKDDESEVTRIVRAIFDAAYEEASLIELNLSFAIWLCNRCIDDLKQGDFERAFLSLGNAHLCRGMAKGLYTGAEQTNLKKELEKKRIYDAIAAVRHAENRSMKEEAIQYYKGNHASFTSKDDAALQIAGKIVPAKFATVRDWLKGVKPE